MSGRMRRLLWIGATAALAPPCLAAPALDDAERLHGIFRDYETWRSEDYPTSNGWPTRLVDVSPAATARRHDVHAELRRRLDAIDPLVLSTDDRVSLDVFDHLLREHIGAFRHGRSFLPIGPLHGVQTMGEEWFGRFTFANSDDAARYILLVESLPRYVDESIDLLREGVRRGRTLSRPAADAVIVQLDELLAGDLDSFGWPFGASWERLAEPARSLIWGRFHARTLPRVRRAYAKLREFIVDEYREQCPEEVGYDSQPEGDAFYAHELRILTTSSLTAREMHELGVGEVARIQSLLVDAIRRTDFVVEFPEHAELDTDEMLRAFREFVLNERRFYCDDTRELVAACRDVAKRVDPWLPSLFRQLPRLTFGIDEGPSKGHHAYVTYSRGSLEHGIPTMVLLNTSYREDFPRFMLPSLVLHEAAPGHHLQLALADEMVDLPRFRREAWIPGYGEGWAMYAEELGVEMHVYADPYDDVGRLHSQLWRACRLVMDTGIHALGWTREEAESYLRDRTLLNERAIDHEVIRAIGWPGQMTTYTVGLLKFRELREQAQQALGEKFDLREFHDVLLRDGCVPLPTLEWRVAEWVEGKSPQ